MRDPCKVIDKLYNYIYTLPSLRSKKSINIIHLPDLCLLSNYDPTRQLQSNRQPPDVFFSERSSTPLSQSLLNIFIHVVPSSIISPSLMPKPYDNNLRIHLFNRQLLLLILDLIRRDILVLREAFNNISQSALTNNMGAQLLESTYQSSR